MASVHFGLSDNLLDLSWDSLWCSLQTSNLSVGNLGFNSLTRFGLSSPLLLDFLDGFLLLLDSSLVISLLVSTLSNSRLDLGALVLLVDLSSSLSDSLGSNSALSTHLVVLPDHLSV